MIAIKFILLLLVFAIATFLGLAFANKYKNRVKDLKEIRNALNIIETKIRYTYQPLPHVFEDIAVNFSRTV